jgi:hypothetical protein
VLEALTVAEGAIMLDTQEVEVVGPTLEAAEVEPKMIIMRSNTNPKMTLTVMTPFSFQ